MSWTKTNKNNPMNVAKQISKIPSGNARNSEDLIKLI